MDHASQIIAIIASVAVPLGAVLTAFAVWLRAVAANLAANNRGQNAALQRIQEGMEHAGTLPPPVAPPESQRGHPRAATPLLGVPVIDKRRGK